MDSYILSRLHQNIDPEDYNFIEFDHEHKILKYKYFSIKIQEKKLICEFLEIKYDIHDGKDVIYKYSKLVNFLNMFVDEIEFLWGKNEI